ncbi:MAG: cation:proton antiporter, partial [Bradyrhizobium sp.]
MTHPIRAGGPISPLSNRAVGLAVCALALICATTSAWAAPAGQSGPSEVVFIAQIVVLLLVGRLLGEAMLRIGQPAVIGQLIAGILLGPSVLGAIWPQAQHTLFPPQPEQKAMIDAVSQLGILMLLLLTGMETDLALVRKVRSAALGISVAGIALPFSCGFALGQFLPDNLLPSPEHRLITSLFLGTALSISSVKIVALVVRDMGFMRRNLGQIIVASAIIDDTIGWIIIAITFSLAQHGAIDAMSVAQSVIGTLAFLVFSYTIGRRIVFRLIRWTNDTFISEVPVITMILVIMGVMALTTHLIGVHSVLGAFVAGVLVGESPILTRHIDEQLRGLITALFAPVFFGMAGLGTDLTVLTNLALLWLMLAVIAIASIGKFLGAFVGGKIGGLSFAESLALACGMNARGSTEVIVASIGLSLGMLSQDLFTVIVAMAVVTTTAMPPTLRWALARLPLGEEERARLEKEEFEARGFVTNLERLLLAVDDSPNGKFAARLAGLIAGLRSMPTTVLELKSLSAPDAGPNAARSGERAVREGAETAQTSEHEADKEPTSVEVTTRHQDKPAEQAVRGEARKGYDLLMIGIAETAENGEFDEQVNRLARGFDGPLAIVDARGAHRKRPRQARFDILVPVTGTEASR